MGPPKRVLAFLLTISIFCAAVAFSVSNVDFIKLRTVRATKFTSEDPAIFLSEASDLIKYIYEQAKTSSADIISAPDQPMKAKLVEDVNRFEKELKDITTIANSYDLDAITDAQVKRGLRNVKYVANLYKLGYDVVQLEHNVGALGKAFRDEFMFDYDDFDKMYSMKDVKDFGLGSVESSKFYWRVIHDYFSDDLEKYLYAPVETIQRHAEEYNISAAELWYPGYTETLMSEMDEVMRQLKPFYERLHAYLRHKLMRKLGIGAIKPKAPIPENFYRQILLHAWDNETVFENDFSMKSLPQYNEIFVDKELDAKKLLETAENFYQSMGFESLTEDFWQKNIEEAASSDEDFCPGKTSSKTANVSLKYCDEADFAAYAKFHELLGNVHGSLLKKDLPMYFYEGYPVGDVLGYAVKLAATTPKHLKSIGLLDDFDITNEILLNRNFRTAVEFMFSLPYLYANAKIMTKFLNEQIETKDLNHYYWQVMEEYAGVEPPIDRHTESLDLPYSFFLNLNDQTNVVGKFAGNILAFQYYRSLCQRIGHTGLLHNCDFYKHTEVGTLFKKMISVGSSKTFEEVHEGFLPESPKLDASAILDYFEPTIYWLSKYDLANVGWEHTTKLLTSEALHSETWAAEFVKQSSTRIYELYEQLIKDLFTKSYETDNYEEDESGKSLFWKLSKSAAAAYELKEISQKAQTINMDNFKDSTLKKAITKLGKMADVFVLGQKLEDFIKNKQRLVEISTDIDIRKYKDGNDEDPQFVAYYPDIMNIFTNSNDVKELKYYWAEWREENAEEAQVLLERIIRSLRDAAEILDYSVSEFWFKQFNPSFLERMEAIINHIKPLYSKLHFYVKTQLLERYDVKEFSNTSGPIPDHLLQQTLLQIWTNESVIEKKYPFKELPPNDEFVKEQNYDAIKLLHLSDEFYKSLGFKPLEEDFWVNRLVPHHDSKNSVNCQATIYDQIPKTYMKYCESVNYRRLLQSHSYLGRLHYAAEKRDLPAYFFDSYLLEYPVGEAVLLSASSPKHAKTLGLAKDFNFSDAVLMNRLFRMGVHTLFNIHKYFVHTKIISEYLDYTVDDSDLTKRYWQLMLQYAGIEPPVDRKNTDLDFPYEFYTDIEQNHQVKKFFSEVLGYQIYEALCKTSGHEGDLNNCDFYGSEKAGNALKEMMQLGSTKPWRNALRVLLGKRGIISAKALLKYYEPLEKWLDNELGPMPEDYDFSGSDRKFLRTEPIFSKDD